MKKIAILGTAPGREDAPFDDDSWEIWALNDAYLSMTSAQLLRVTRWWELHGDTPITRARRPPDHWEMIDALDIPVYTFYDVPVKRKVRFTLEDIARAGLRTDYFACTMAYQIAQAISEGATHIALYGICLTGSREALVERPCVEWWLGLAEGRGIEVTVTHPYNFGLGRHLFRYALDDHDERKDTHALVQSFTASAVHWLVDETARLTLSMMSQVTKEEEPVVP